MCAQTVVGEWFGALQTGRGACWDWRVQRVGGAAPITPPSQPGGLDKRGDKTVAGEGGEKGRAAGAQTASTAPPVRTEGLSGTNNKLSAVDAAREALVAGTPTAEVLLQVAQEMSAKSRDLDALTKEIHEQRTTFTEEIQKQRTTILDLGAANDALTKEIREQRTTFTEEIKKHGREISAWSAWTRVLVASTWWPIFEGELRHTALDDMGVRIARYLQGGVWYDEDTKKVLQERDDGLTRLRLTTAGLYDRKLKNLRSPTVLATCADVDTDKGRAFLAATRFATRRIPVDGWSTDKAIPMHIVKRPHLNNNFVLRVGAAHPFLHALKSSTSAPDAMLEVINTTHNFEDKAATPVSPLSEKLVHAVIDDVARVCRATGDHAAAAKYALVRKRISDLVVQARNPLASGHKSRA
jgi:hypothetical protein